MSKATFVLCLILAVAFASAVPAEKAEPKPVEKDAKDLDTASSYYGGYGYYGGLYPSYYSGYGHYPYAYRQSYYAYPSVYSYGLGYGYGHGHGLYGGLW